MFQLISWVLDHEVKFDAMQQLEQKNHLLQFLFVRQKQNITLTTVHEYLNILSIL